MRRPQYSPRRLTLATAVVVLAAAASACGGPRPSSGPALGASHSEGAARPAATAAPAAPATLITIGEARQLLTRYVTVVNAASKRRATHLLRPVEAGSSYRLDAGRYRWTRVSDPKNSHYIAVSAARATYFLPRKSSHPAWWAAAVTWRQPRHRHQHGRALLVFTRTGSGQWRQVMEPNFVPGGSIPAVAAAPPGYVDSARAAAPLAIPLGEVANVTAAVLDQAASAVPNCPRPGTCHARSRGHANKISVPGAGGLADVHDQAFWARQLRQVPGATDSDEHAVIPGAPVFTLPVSGGGLLVFYQLKAVLTLAPPTGLGYRFRITIPGFYTAKVARTRAQLVYAEQFVVFDPPLGHGRARVVADIAGPIAR
jgi:hypothetical protein